LSLDGDTLSERPPSSICAIVLTLDEEDNVDRCLASVGWCDDLVVVDSGSTDSTIARARTTGARVFQHLQEPPFRISDQRNWALDNCDVACDWVLFLDADEVVPEPLRQEICRRTSETVADGLQLPQKYLFLGRWMQRSQRYPQWHDRLVRVGVGGFEGGVWEHFSAAVRTEKLGEPYLHFANSKGFSEWLIRHDRYSSWEAEAIVRYLGGQGRSSFRTRRRLGARAAAAHLWPARPLLRFLYTYFVRLGFTEGVPGLMLALRYAMYEYMIVEKVAESSRHKQGRDL